MFSVCTTKEGIAHVILKGSNNDHKDLSLITNNSFYFQKDIIFKIIPGYAQSNLKIIYMI